MSENDIISRTSAADLSAKKGYAIKLDSANKIALSASNADGAIGFLIDGNDATTKTVSAQLNGICWAKAGDTITLGTHFYLAPDSAGKLVPVSTDTKQHVAIPLSDAVDGEDILVLICRGTFAG